jgi:hypothetical protein
VKTGQKQGFINTDTICESAVKQGKTALFRVLPDILTGKVYFTRGILWVKLNRIFWE